METTPSTSAPATLTGSPKTFIFFPELPLELRLKIFKYAMLPRTVQLLLPKSDPQLLALKGPQPALFQVNNESRHEASRTYSPLDLDGKYFQPNLYFDFDMDTLYFSNRHELDFFLQHASRHVTRQVQYLTLSSKAICARRPPFLNYKNRLLDILFKFRYLENFRVLERGHRKDFSLDWALEFALDALVKIDPERKFPSFNIGPVA